MVGRNYFLQIPARGLDWFKGNLRNFEGEKGCNLVLFIRGEEEIRISQRKYLLVAFGAFLGLGFWGCVCLE